MVGEEDVNSLFEMFLMKKKCTHEAPRDGRRMENLHFFVCFLKTNSLIFQIYF